MAIILLVFSISLSMLDQAGIDSLRLAGATELTTATSWVVLALGSIASIFVFKLIGVLAGYFKRWQ